jgi:hypothetical protein
MKIRTNWHCKSDGDEWCLVFRATFTAAVISLQKNGVLVGLWILANDCGEPRELVVGHRDWPLAVLAEWHDTIDKAQRVVNT